MKGGALLGLLLSVLAWPAGLRGQEYLKLRINEVIASNSTQLPLDIGGGTPDMLELCNPTGQVIQLGTNDPDTSLALSDTPELPVEDPLTPQPELYLFRDGIAIGQTGFLVIFCDGNLSQDFCEPHASFKISASGDEPISLWGPVVGTDERGYPVRELIDQVWLPPLPEDVSYGRYPDGSGPFVFNLTGDSTFGGCVLSGSQPLCPGSKVRYCSGAPNKPGGNIEPRIELHEASTNAPAAGESVVLRVKVEDDKEPTPPNISSVQIVYRVRMAGGDPGPDEIVDCAYDSGLGVEHACLHGNRLPDGTCPCAPEDRLPDGTCPAGADRPEAPLHVWTEWVGEIPGQPAGAKVEFYLKCSDAEGLLGQSPATLCEYLFPEAPGVGPCDREFGGPGCQRDTPENDRVTCGEPSSDVDPDRADALEEGICDDIQVTFAGMRYVACDTRFTYASGYEPLDLLKHLVINEVVASQTRVLMDPTESQKLCRTDNPTCKFDDFIELHNGSGETIDLSGLWLSQSRFHPQGWQFPRGSKIAGGEYLIVWLDGDGAKCPCELRPEPPNPDAAYCGTTEDPTDAKCLHPCFWECPDPNDPAAQSYHANFSIEAGHDQIYIYDTAERSFGRIHGTEFDDLAVDHSLSLIPDGDTNGCWIQIASPTPQEPNDGAFADCPLPKFLRGDANSDCRVDITDGVFTLNFLFLGERPPSCPDAADADDSGVVIITDPIFILRFLFLGGPAPPDPGPAGAPGPDVTPDRLGSCAAPDC